jgi:nudix motif 8
VQKDDLARFDERALEALEGRLRSLARRRLKEEARRAAVLVPLCLANDEPSVLFTRRTETVGTHKGQVSFPGGMVDDTDTDVDAAALRELEEELGLAQSDVRVLGRFHDARAITGVQVTPVLGFLGEVDVEALDPSPHEIDHVFTLSLRELEDPAQRYQQEYGAGARMQVFDAGPFPVWGLTAVILEGVLTELLGLSLPETDVRPFERPA